MVRTKYIATPAALRQALLRAKQLQNIREAIPRASTPPPQDADVDEAPSCDNSDEPKSEVRTRCDSAAGRSKPPRGVCPTLRSAREEVSPFTLRDGLFFEAR